MKIRLFAVLLTLTMLLTACSTAGTSSGTSQAPEVSSKVEVSSVAEVSSAAASSAEPVQYMSDEEYLSKNRDINRFEAWDEYTFTNAEGETCLGKNGMLISPFHPGYGDCAVTKTGVLLLYAGDIYEVHEPGELAERIYTPFYDFRGYRVEFLCESADEYIFFVVLRKADEPEKFKVCRVFRDTGRTDVIATDENIPGNVSEMTVRSNTRIFVVSHMPYEIPEDCDTDEAMNIESRARRCTFIDTIRGVWVCDNDVDAYVEEMKELIEIEKREQAEADATSSTTPFYQRSCTE